MKVNIDPDTICLLGSQLKCAGRFNQSGVSWPSKQGLWSFRSTVGKETEISMRLSCVCLNPPLSPALPPKTACKIWNLKDKERKNRMNIDCLTSDGPVGVLVKPDWRGLAYLCFTSPLLKKGKITLLGQIHEYVESYIYTSINT